MKLVCFFCVLIIGISGRNGFGPTNQDWGYVTVRPSAHMFWWLHYTTANVSKVTDRPLVIWLQGGPGASSTGFGNFAELGPLDENLQTRNFTWVKDVNVLFVDNPVGTGFSYVDNTPALTKNNKEIAEDFLALMQGFYEALPDFKGVPLYIMCESYGGKMAIEIALLLQKATEDGKIESELIGVGLGDSWVSPIDAVLTWAPYLLNIGAIDKDGYAQIDASAQATKKALEEGKYTEATQLWGVTEIVILRVTGGIDFYNILSKATIYTQSPFTKLIKPSVRLSDGIDEKIARIMKNQVSEVLNITYEWGSQSGKVFSTLSGDFMKSVTHIVEEVLNTTNIKVAVFNGQLDLIVDTPGTIKWVQELNWVDKSDWDAAPRKPFYVDSVLEGYEKKYGNLAFYWVNRAGHMVPSENPPAMDYILRELMDNYITLRKL